MANKVVLGIGEPSMAVIRPPSPNGAVLLLLPGGGYVEQWFEKEGLEIARRFAPAGITSFVLRYRLPQEGWAEPRAVALQDAQRAVRLIRARAPAMGLDPARVCAMGFSAGGHLAASLSTRSEAAYPAVGAADAGSTRPDLAVLVYPAIDMALSMRDVWRPVALLGPEPGEEAVLVHTPSRFVNRATPPTFLVHTVDDQLVSAEHSLAYAAALQAQRVPYELHIFEEGRHGFALRRPAEAPVAAWPDLFLRWAARHRFLPSAWTIGGGAPSPAPVAGARPSRSPDRRAPSLARDRGRRNGALSETTTPQDRLPSAEEAFAERLAPLLELVERWRARIVSEAQGWPTVPLSGLDPDDPRRLAARIAEELLRARGHLVAAEEQVRSAAALRRRMLRLDEPDGEPGS